MSQARSFLRRQFIEDHNYDPQQVEFLASDMSTRQYYRLYHPKRVLMDAPYPENPQQFITVADYLRTCGLRSPLILGHQLQQGFVWLEDFGDHTFSKVLCQNPEQEEELYSLAVAVLKHLHRQSTVQPYFIGNYTSHTLLEEATLFMDWYWPTLYPQTTYLTARKQFVEAWQSVLDALPTLPQSLVLRDYHIDNLMLISNQTGLPQCGLLDFQDAVWGSVVYDFISLLQDARRTVNAPLQEKLWRIFLQDVPPHQHETYKAVAFVLGTTRHAKVMGVFIRYALRQGKTNYLIHLPRLWQYLEDNLRHPLLKPVCDWFDHYLPPEKRRISL